MILLTCAKYSELMTDYVLGELPPEQVELVAGHLKKCANCKREYQQLKELTAGLNQLSEDIRMPQYVEQRIEEAFKFETKKTKKTPGRLLVISLVASMMIAVVALGVWNNDLMSEKPQAGFVAMDKQHQETDYGNGKGITLSEEGLEIQAAKDSATITGLNSIPENMQPAAVLGEGNQSAKISLNDVKEIEISDPQGKKLLLGSDQQEIIKMIVLGLNDSKDSATTARSVTSSGLTSIKIYLTDGTFLEVQYNRENNMAMINEVVVTPGASLADALNLTAK